MPFNPALPQTNAPVVSAELRDQFNGPAERMNQCALTIDVNDLVYSQTAGNVDTIQPLALAVSNPPTQAQVQPIADWFDQLLLMLKRA